eukprot:14245998-Alexandrium_andersonii.AAC.1
MLRLRGAAGSASAARNSQASEVKTCVKMVATPISHCALATLLQNRYLHVIVDVGSTTMFGARLM